MDFKRFSNYGYINYKAIKSIEQVHMHIVLHATFFFLIMQPPVEFNIDAGQT